jgi:hypothetical protein
MGMSRNSPLWTPELLCEKCGRPGQPDHPCPFQLEVHNDDKVLCNCCRECQAKCGQGILLRPSRKK